MSRTTKMTRPLAAALIAGHLALPTSVLAEDLTEVNVLMPFPEGIPFTPLIVSREQGFFADQGITVTTSVADGSGYLAQQIVAGNAEFALMGAADAVVAFDKRDDVRVLFCHQVKNVYRIVARADTGISSMAELEDKTLGYTEPGGGESQLVSAAIDEAGLEVGKSITLLPIGPAGPQSLVALQNDRVQAYSSSFPDVAVLAASGIEWTDITPAKYSNVPGTCMVTTEKVLSTEDGMMAAKALSTGWVQGQYFSIDNAEQAFEDVCTAVPSACENEPVAKALFVEAMNLIRPDEGNRPGALTPSSWQTVVEILSTNDVVDADLDVAPLISGDNVQAVIDTAYAGR